AQCAYVEYRRRLGSRREEERGLAAALRVLDRRAAHDLDVRALRRNARDLRIQGREYEEACADPARPRDLDLALHRQVPIGDDFDSHRAVAVDRQFEGAVAARPGPAEFRALVDTDGRGGDRRAPAGARAAAHDAE